MRDSQFLRSTTAMLIALTLVACGSDGNGSAGGNNGNTGGSSTLVAVSSEPAGENCASGGKRIDNGRDTNGNGVLDASEITDTQYVCNDDPPVAHTIGGTISGLDGSMILQNNSDVYLPISASGSFTFDAPVIRGDAYAVTVHTQPLGQTCTVANGSGIATANVTNVQVSCTTHPLTLVSTTPAADATDVDRTVSPSMVFSAALDTATVVPANVKLTSAGGDQPITLAVAGTQLTAIPTRRLSPVTTYTLQAATAVRGIHGERLAAAALGSFTTRDGNWREPVRVSPGGQPEHLHIAVDAHGNAMLVWYQPDGGGSKIWANRYTPDGGWGTAVLVENDYGNATNPRVAIDADGNALAVWRHYGPNPYSIFANRYTVGIGWGTPTLIETNSGEAIDPKIEFDAAGNALAVWGQYEGSRIDIWSNRYTAGVGWGEAMLVETSDAGVSESPQLAMHASGNAVAVWVQDHVVWANHYTVGEGWGTPVPIEEANSDNSFDLDLAIDASGNAMAVWCRSDGARCNISSNRSTPDGHWGTATLIETEDTAAGRPSIAMDAQGNALVVWEQGPGDTQILSNRYTPEDGWGTAEPIQADVTVRGVAAQIVMDAAGNALALWYESGGRLHYNRYVNGRGWGTSSLLNTGYDAGSGQLGFTIAMNPSGNAIAAWDQVDGGSENVYVNRFE